jgi:hypothetical protein
VNVDFVGASGQVPDTGRIESRVKHAVDFLQFIHRFTKVNTAENVEQREKDQTPCQHALRVKCGRANC